MRARDRIQPRGGARSRRARLRDPAGGARGVRRVPRVRLEDARSQSASWPLADQGRGPATHRVVEQADGRNRRHARVAGHDRHRPDRSRAAYGRGRARAGGRSRGEARRDRPARHGTARAAAGGHAGRVGGEPRSCLHGRVGGVRAGAPGQRVRRPALRGRRDGDDRRPAHPRQHRRLASRREPSGGRELGGRARAEDGSAGAHRRLGRPHGRGCRDDAPHRIQIDCRRSDRRRGSPVGRGRHRERGPAPAREREPTRGFLRARLAGRRQRSGARGPHRVARPRRQGG